MEEEMSDFRSRAAWLVLAALVLPAGAMAAGGGGATAGDPVKAQAETKDTPLHISGEIKVRGEMRGNADFGLADGDTQEFVGQLTRLMFSGEVKGVRYGVELIDGREFGAERKSGSAKASSLHQSYVEVGDRWRVRIGRQEITLGKKRLIGSTGWGYKNLAAYDGARLLSDIGRGHLDLFAVRVAEGALDVSDDTHLLGASYSFKVASWWKPEAYLLWKLVDDDAETSADDGTSMPIAGLYGQIGPLAGFALDYEAVYQGGTREGLDHEASLLHVALTYTQPDSGRFWLGVAFNRASGDGNPTDGTSRGFDKLYGINHSHYGFIDYQDPRNMRDLRLTAGAKAASWAKLSADYHVFRLADARDAWYSRNAAVSLQDETGAAGSDVGSELDLVLKADLPTSQKLEIGFATYFPGTFVERTSESHAASSSWGYVQLRTRF